MSTFTQDQIAEIKQMIQDANDQESDTGNPFTNPHEHNGNDNFQINPLNLIGFTPIPVSPQQYTNNGGVTYINGYGANLVGGDTSHASQFINDTSIASYPIPIVVGNGAGGQGAFNGGWAPDGTLVAFLTGDFTTSALYIRFDGTWYGTGLTLTPITP